MELSQVRAFEDKQWESCDQELVWRHEVAVALVEEEPVLDICGGDGLFLRLLRERKGFQNLTLLDISHVAVKKARQKGIDAQVADISNSFPDDTFGTACALDLLEYLYDPLPPLKGKARIAQSIVIVVPNFHYWKDRVCMLIGKVPFQCKPKRGHVHWFSYLMFQELIAWAGLQPGTIVFTGLHRLGLLSGWLVRWHPNLLAHSFAVRLVKRDSHAV